MKMDVNGGREGRGKACKERKKKGKDGGWKILRDATLPLFNNPPFLSSCLLSRRRLSIVKDNLDWLSYFTLTET